MAAVIAMVSPSHPSPAVIHRTSISAIDGDIRVETSLALICSQEALEMAPFPMQTQSVSSRQDITTERPDHPALE
jgi:hypothetical protein